MFKAAFFQIDLLVMIILITFRSVVIRYGHIHIYVYLVRDVNRSLDAAQKKLQIIAKRYVNRFFSIMK